jgi:hypothetical protein
MHRSIITTADQLMAGPESILGRYGLSVPIVQYGSPAGSTTITDGFRIVDPRIGPSIDGNRTLNFSLVKRHGRLGMGCQRASLSADFFEDCPSGIIGILHDALH